MLTKDQLRYRVHKRVVKPTFLAQHRESVMTFAAQAVTILEAGEGSTRGDIEETLLALGSPGPPKVADGLRKLLMDRTEFEEPDEDAFPRREVLFDHAARALRSLSEDAEPDALEAALEAAIPDLTRAREGLYADHPKARPLRRFRSLSVTQLLDRYDLATVQGLLLRARRVEIQVEESDLAVVRRLMRWLRFCRLVADVRQSGDRWSVTVEGPAEILSMQKKYGLQLALFFQAVPLFKVWSMESEIELSRGRFARLSLDHSSGLVSSLQSGMGHVPEEVEVIRNKLEAKGWAVDLAPVPRPVGLSSLCVPDLEVRRLDGSATVWFEFFHAWHAGAFRRRLVDLASRPDPSLYLFAQKKLLTEDDADHPQVRAFGAFPSERAIHQILKAWEAA